MKKLIKITVVLLMTLSLILSFASCNKQGVENADALWESATYTEDTTVGEGSKTLTLTVEAGDKSVVLTVKSDAATVGEALIAHDIIKGDESAYGLYVKEVNGIKADYDADKAYWSFNKDGQYVMTGVDTTELNDGDKYEFVYTKG